MSIEILETNKVKLVPNNELSNGQEYWLLIKKGIKLVDDKDLKEDVISIVRVKD